MADIFTQRSLEKETGLAIALVRSHPWILLNTVDQRAKEWNPKWFNPLLMHLRSPEHYFIEFSALASVVVLCQSALPGASYFCVSDFFDFCQEETGNWLQQAIKHKIIRLSIYHEGILLTSSGRIELEEDFIAHVKGLLSEGREWANKILTRRKPKRRAMKEQSKFAGLNVLDVDLNGDLDQSPPSFELARMATLSSWPEDPFDYFRRKR